MYLSAKRSFFSVTPRFSITPSEARGLFGPDSDREAEAAPREEATLGQEVADALLQSLDALEGNLKLGVIDTIGRRRDPIAITRLAKLLKDPDLRGLFVFKWDEFDNHIRFPLDAAKDS